MSQLLSQTHMNYFYIFYNDPVTIAIYTQVYLHPSVSIVIASPADIAGKGWLCWSERCADFTPSTVPTLSLQLTTCRVWRYSTPPHSDATSPSSKWCSPSTHYHSQPATPVPPASLSFHPIPSSTQPYTVKFQTPLTESQFSPCTPSAPSSSWHLYVGVTPLPPHSPSGFPAVPQSPQITSPPSPVTPLRNSKASCRGRGRHPAPSPRHTPCICYPTCTSYVTKTVFPDAMTIQTGISALI